MFIFGLLVGTGVTSLLFLFGPRLVDKIKDKLGI